MFLNRLKTRFEVFQHSNPNFFDMLRPNEIVSNQSPTFGFIIIRRTMLTWSHFAPSYLIRPLPKINPYMYVIQVINFGLFDVYRIISILLYIAPTTAVEIIATPSSFSLLTFRRKRRTC